MDYLFSSGSVKPFEKQHLIAPWKRVTGNFDPDRAAYDVVRVVYTAFGLESKTITFFTDEGKFVFPSS